MKKKINKNEKDSIDMLSDLFNRQKAFSLALGDDFSKMSLEDKENYTKDKVLAMLDETHEVLREINWKSWKKTKKEIDQDHLLEELSDTLHFFINLCLCWNFSAEDIYNAYMKKDEENYNRIKKAY